MSLGDQERGGSSGAVFERRERAPWFTLGRALTGAALVLVALFAAALVLPMMLDWQYLRPGIEARLSEAMGRPARIEGPITLRLVPSPEVTVRRVRILPGAKPEPSQGSGDQRSVEIASLKAGFGFGDLRAERPTIDRLAIEGLRLPMSVFEQPGHPLRPAVLAEALSEVSSVSIENAALAFELGGEARVRRVSLSEISLRYDAAEAGQARLRGTARLNGLPLSIEGRLGGVVRDEDAGERTLRLRVLFPGAGIESLLEGRAAIMEGRFRGRFTLAAAQLAGLSETLTAVVGGESLVPSQAGEQKLSLSARLTVDGLRSPAIDAEDVTFSLGPVTATGTLGLSGDSWRAGRLTAELTGETATLDTLLGTRAPGEHLWRLAETLGAQVPSGAWQADIGLAAPTLLWSEAALQNFSTRISLRDGRLYLEHLEVVLPGQTKIAWRGVSADGRLAGRASASTTQARRLATWLGLSLPEMPDEALQVVSFRSDVRLEEGATRLTGLTLSLDGQTMTGGLSWERAEERDNPPLTVSVNAQRLAPLPYAPLLARFLGRDALPASPFEVLPEVLPGGLVTVTAEVETLVLGAETLRGLSIDAVRDPLGLDLRRFSLADWRGVRLEGSGLVLDPASQWRSDPTGLDERLFTGTAQVEDLAALAPVLLPVPGSLSPLTLKGPAELQVSAFRTVTEPPGGAAPSILPQGLGLTGLRAGGAGESAGALTFLALRGADAGAPQLQVLITDGTTEEGAGASGTLLSERYGDQRRWLIARQDPEQGALALNLVRDAEGDRAVYEGFIALEQMPASAWLGERFSDTRFNLSARLVGPGDAIRVLIEQASFGDEEITGTGTLTLTGERPALGLDVRLAALDLGAVFAPLGTGAGPWPRGLAELPELPGDLTLGLDVGDLSAGGMRFIGLRSDLTLSAQRWGLETRAESIGDMGGPVSGAASLTESEAGLSLSMTGEAAPFDLLAFPWAEDFFALSGPISGSVALEGEGGSWITLSQSLSGTATVQVGPGTIHGLDLREMTTRWDTLAALSELETVISRTTEQGQTRFEAVTWQIPIAEGTVSMPALSLPTEAGPVTLTGQVQLAPWLLALRTRWQGEGLPAPLGLAFAGPLNAPMRLIEADALRTALLERLEQSGAGRITEDELPAELRKLLEDAEDGSNDAKP